MLELEEALARILAAIPKPVKERVALSKVHGRVLAEALYAPLDLPVFDNSAVDGYAVVAEDVATANPEVPVHLRLIGRITAGETFDSELTRGTSARLFTGSSLPRGANAVVMQEDTRLEPNHPGEVLIVGPVKPWENVRFQGEDVKRGALLVEAGAVVTIGRITMLTAMGLSEITVGRCPVVGVLATGSELKEAGQPLAPGQIYESNRATLAPLIENSGCSPVPFPIVPDALDLTCAALEQAFAACDVVITCGGVSVGEMDFVKRAFGQLGGDLQFWKVAIKPGRPFVFGRLGQKLLFGLPGNPISAFVTFLLLVRPALLSWQGASDVLLPSLPCTLAGPLANPGERRHFMRVTVDTAGKVRSAGIQASHILSSAAVANGLVDMPPRATFSTGDAVQVLRWESLLS
jgi:molybdopterin molybdotransferase